MKRTRIQSRQRIWRIIEIACFCFLVILVILIGQRMHAEKQVAQEEQQSAGITIPLQRSPAPDSTELPAVMAPQNDFGELLAQNGDFRGLLSFGADHSLYVCQGSDNLFYMNHQFDKTENPAGMIFMDYRNVLSPRSDNLILYGHNMRNGSRFGTLKRYTQADYLLANPIFRFADLYETRDYIPFAIFHTTVLTDHASYFAFDQTDFSDKAAFDDYVRAVKERSVLELPVDVQYGDKLLTLATCSSEQERGRLVIVCKAR